MIRKILLALGLMLGAGIVAQTHAFTPLAPGETLQGSFVQERHLDGFAAPLRTEGRFLLAPGKGLIWRGDRPFTTVTTITAAGIAQAIDGNQVLQMPATRLPFLRRFYDMLSGALAGDLRAIERDFTVSRQEEGQTWKVLLQPIRADDPLAAQIRSITLTGTRFVEKVDIRKSGGDWEILSFQDQVVSTSGVSREDAKLFEKVSP